MVILCILIESSLFGFDGKIGIETLVNVAMIAVGMIASWYKIQARAEALTKDTEETREMVKEVNKQVQLLSLTIERLSTLSQLNERRVDRIENGH